MDNSASVPTWSNLFGSLDTKEADAGRSVIAPAAYLADLLQLLKDRFDPSDFNKFKERRPDITARILLNGEQSFSLVRQLDIANQVLGDRIASLAKSPADALLAGAQHPFSLPFEYQHERIRQLLLLLRTPYRDLYTSFAQDVDVDVLARERLGLSPVRAETVVTDLSGDAAGLRAAYGLAPDETLSSLADLERFRRATQLNGTSLRELLFAQLSQSASKSDDVSEREAAGQLFINHGLGGFVRLDGDEQQLSWSEESKGIPDAWFDHVHRLLCLSRWTGIDVPSLDLVLRQLCQNTLDVSALRRLAMLVDLRERTGATIEVLCSLLGELDGSAALGAGDDPTQPASLFDRVFNGEAARLARRYVRSGSDYLPQAYKGWEALEATGDLLSDVGANKELRVRIQTALGISARDLSAVVTRFRDRATTRGRVSRLAAGDSRGLSTLHRVVRLAEFVNLSPPELLQLVEVLEKDSSLKMLNAFDVLHHQDITQADLYEVLEQGSTDARSWLIQNLIAVSTWAGVAGLAPEDLAAIAVIPNETTPKDKAVLLATAQALHEAFLPTALRADSLKSADISERAARIALAIFREPARQLVSTSDARLVTWDESKAREAAHAAVEALNVVSVEDIEALRLGEDLATYLQALLVRRGVLDVNGILHEERFPARAEDLVLEPDGAAQFGQIFDFLHDLYITTLTGSADAQAHANNEDEAFAAEADVEAQAEDEGEAFETEAGAEAQADDEEEAIEVETSASADDEEAFEAEPGTEAQADDEDEAFTAEAHTEAPRNDEAAARTDVELQLYLSDLLKLGFEMSEADEWIERLTFLRVLDAADMVQNPALFSDPANRDNLQISLGLDSFRTEIHAQLAAQRDRWLSAQLKLPDDIWDGLPLTLAEREALEQNLIFNSYLDTTRRIVDRKVLQALTPDTFDLALPFYRHRRSILAALQGVVVSYRDHYLKVGPEDLRPLADKFIAINAHKALAAAYLDGRGRLSSALLAQIDSEQPPIDLGPTYSTAQQQRIWSLLRQINTEASKFRLTNAALASIDITGEHATEVVVSLCAAGYLRPDRSLSADQVARFVVVNSAQDFTVPDYTDYARDIFFLVHDVAVAVDTAVNALMTALRAMADAQEQAVFEAIGSQIELSAEATAAIVRPLLRDEPHPTVALLAPVLRAVGPQDILAEPPRDRTFRTTIGRTHAFAHFARKLRMSPRAIEVAFQDQQLVDKFPEAIELPQGVDRIDALWTGPNGQLSLFHKQQYWTFDTNTLAVIERNRPLATLCADFKDLQAVDAVYTLPGGEHWLLAEGRAWRWAAESKRWVETKRTWGRVQSRFDDPANIDAALLDHEGRIHLFSGDQYVRYSNWPQEFVDEGYPRRIAAQWSQELGFGPLPSGWDGGIDAAVGRKDEVTWLFKRDRYVASTEPGVERSIVDVWGRVRNNLASASRVDAVLDIGGCCGVVVGDQVSVFSNSLESEGLTADEGYPRPLAAVFPDLPEAFAHGLDAGLTDEDGTIHLFRDQDCASRKEGKWQVFPTRARWGRVKNTLQETGCVDAALAGLDGKIYLFSGDQYVRYSGVDLSRIDEGYPRTISRDWGGLTQVDAAFVLDGKTYVFSRDHDTYVRYSTRDYTKPDEGYPKKTDDNWWNLPVALLKLKFDNPDAVFVAADGRVHLFRGDQTVSFDHNHRWWSEPVPIREAWSSLPSTFTGVSAAFTGRDGRSYLFSTPPLNKEEDVLFVRYTDPTFQRVDDRFPKPVKEHWGKLANNLERTGRIDAAVTLISPVTETNADGTLSNKKVCYRYLFSGDQFYRYSSDEQPFVDEGYPLRIQNNLRREPHFVHLDAPAERGVDGVWADTGNVFVFISDRIHVASVAHLRQLYGLGVDEPRAADVEEGRLTVFGKDGWRHIRPPEAHSQAPEPALPRVLRTVPSLFQKKLQEKPLAILRALDKNVYLFSDDQCYDQSLERQYPAGAVWGRVRNRIAEDERVDSALMGRDGKLYLFRGDQFVSYTSTPEAPAAIPTLADTTPSSVADRWGGLSNVRYAFVHQDVTYLLEAPAEDGTFRYVRYFGTDYSHPNEPTPLVGDFSFWQIPADYVTQGFDRVDAVFSEGGDLVLIRNAQFLHYEAATDTWTFPRPLSLLWPGLPHRYPDFDTIRAAVRGLDNKTYFFSDGAWLAHDGERPSELATISSRWARLRNRITGSNRVDATFVHGEQTFLFSGDEYVRYTGSNYQYVDAGYPRPIAGFLRQEAPFQQLPADVEIAFKELKPEDVWLAAAFCTGGVVYVRVAGQSYALSAQLSRSYPLQQITRVRNELVRRARVDAAFARRDGALLLLSGDQYVRYSRLDLEVVDDGYPRAIGESLLHELADQPPTLPLGFQHDLDAALYDKNGTLVLFKGKYFVRFEPNARGTELVPQEIKGVWGRVSNPFLPSPDNPQPRIDAAFVAPDHALYVFQGSQYVRYTKPDAEFVDEGYPRAIRDRWGDLPATFEAGIDGGFVFGGRTYLCCKEHYVRYSDPSYGRMDPIYPQLFTSRWCASNDFLLRDLRTIQRYVALDQSHPSEDASLTDFLLASPHAKVDPYALLATLFDWEVGDLQWLKRRDAFLYRPTREQAAEVRFDIEQVLRIHSTMELARRLGSHPQELYEQVWSQLYPNPSAPATAANTLERLLCALYPGEDWKRIERQLGDALSRMRRDAQVAWLVAHNRPEKLADARDLSDLVLTDVEVDASVEASPITEAIAAIQLYFHRYLTNLEPVAATGDDGIRRAQFKEQWRWLKNYRIWEANRKVFLYPESYIRPELRDTRTAAFKALQDNLHQGEITEASVTQAYKKYLDEYTEVSRLIIAGGYVQPDPKNPDDTELTLFGATRTEPRRYYYRTATFKNGDVAGSAVWRAWKALGIEINANRVYPVRAFGRTFVFWTEVEQKKPEAQASITLQSKTKDGIQEVSGEERVEYRLKVLYSFHDLSEQWTPPQTLGYGRTESAQIQAPHLQVTCNGNDGEESIIVTFRYDLNYAGPPYYFTPDLITASHAQDVTTLTKMVAITTLAVARKDIQAISDMQRLAGLGPPLRILAAKRLTADLTVVDASAVTAWDGRVDMLNTLFDASESNNLKPDSVVMLGSAGQGNGAPWYSFDLKGGSFLARPVTPPQQESEGRLLPLIGNTEDLPQWSRVDACLDTFDGRQYLFNNQRQVYCTRGDLKERPINERWGLRYTKVHADEKVDAAWQRGGVLFLARGNRYVKYSHGLEWADDTGERGSEAERQEDRVPNWPSIDAAFTENTTTDKKPTTWFFQGTKYVALDAANTFSEAKENKERWGHEPNVFTLPANGSVVAAFHRDGCSYLLGPTSYTWYDDSYYFVQPGDTLSVIANRFSMTLEDAARENGITNRDLIFVGQALKLSGGTPPALTELCERPEPQSLGTLLAKLNCSNITAVAANDAKAPIVGVVDTGTELRFKVSPNTVYSLKDGKVSKMTNAEAEPRLAGFTYNGKSFALAADTVEEGNKSRKIPSGVVVAALLAGDEKLYLFGKDKYVRLEDKDISLEGIGTAIDDWSRRAVPLVDRWGRVRNVFTQGGPVTAAFVRGAHTFLVSGDSYARYTGAEYRFVDPGYPRARAGNPDGLPEDPFDAAVEVDGRTCYFMGAQHAFSDALAVKIPNQSRWGRIRSNILLRGVEAAYRVEKKHYLFSGNEVACYTAGAAGTLPAYMDGAPVRAEFGVFRTVRGAFSYKGFLYLVNPDSFVCCTVDNPEQPLPGYPRNGQARALVADLRARFHLATDVSDNLLDGCEVYALSLQDSTLLLDIDASVPGLRIFRLDLANGQLSPEWFPARVNWAALRSEGVDVALARERYSFRADQVMKTGVTAPRDSQPEVRSIAAVWGGRPFDTAIRVDDKLFLFVGNRYCTLLKRDATDDSDGSIMVRNLQNALARSTPIRGSLTNLPAELLDGFDAALPLDGGLYIFKADRFAHFGRDFKWQSGASPQYELVRLTTSTAARLNHEFFTGGVQRLLSLQTQQVDETPGFSDSTSTPTIICVNADRVKEGTLPIAGHLDFDSANGIYLWEIFFHAPLLIADMLSTAQRFEEAKAWYEHIFDPTEPADVWKFLPFLTVDVERIVIEIEDRLEQLDKAGVDIKALRTTLDPDFKPLDKNAVFLKPLREMDDAFQGERPLSDSELDRLQAMQQLTAARQALDRLGLGSTPTPQTQTLRNDLRELIGLLEGLKSRWESMQTSPAQVETYLDDPFDPHAIAALRPIAYRKAVVMRYLDNLLDWGDMLFSQYSRESINEARMLYVQAWNLLGRRPESLGRKMLPADCAYNELRDAQPGEYDLLLQLKDSRAAELSFAAPLLVAPNEAPAQPYFFIPPNEELEQYWTRVADRLYKIRHSLNLFGVQQSLVLFEPPINPMALVQAVAGAGILAGQLDGAVAVEVPHYRFSFLLAKAQGLVQKVTQLGSELLAALEKRDAETLSQLQMTQEGLILALTRDLQKAQLEEAKTNLHSLEKAEENAQKRKDTYTNWMAVGYLPMEGAQIGLLTYAAGLNISAGVLNAVATGLALVPKSHIGLFTFGLDTPDFHQGVNYGGQALQSTAGGLQGLGEILGITAQHERMVNDWQLQRDLASIDLEQIEAQIEGARWQVEAAHQQIMITERQIAHNEAVSRFYRSKFANRELYEWMAGRLSDLHYQTYQLALSMARAAERAFQFERGRDQGETSFIQGQQWDSQRKGLLAGYTLGLALDRLEAAFIATDARRFEITKSIALVQIDPMAFLKLKTEGACEFELSEALFDYDFPGHYCRQIKTIAVDLELGEGVFVNATLTQLTNRVIMEPDPKAVSFLLEPKETPPRTIRSNWKAQQQVALSSHTQYEPNSGVFELRFDNERYLPFEGTGAVSRWRLKLGGPPGAYDLRNLAGVTITLKYTALQGGEAFAAAVRGLLKPTDALRAFNLGVDYGEVWQAFLQQDTDVLELPLYPEYFPNMASGRIRAIFTRYETDVPGTAAFSLDMGQPVPLPDGKTVDTSGLTVRATGTTLRLRLQGDKANLRNVYLVMGYKGGVR